MIRSTSFKIRIKYLPPPHPGLSEVAFSQSTIETTGRTQKPVDASAPFVFSSSSSPHRGRWKGGCARPEHCRRQSSSRGYWTTVMFDPLIFSNTSTLTSYSLSKTGLVMPPRAEPFLGSQSILLEKCSILCWRSILNLDLTLTVF